MSTFSKSGSLATGNLLQTALAESELRLFKSEFDPTYGMPLSAFDAQECDFSGYTAGGKTITAFLEPLTKVGGGTTIAAPTQQWDFTPPGEGDPVLGDVGGWYLVTAGGVLVAFEKYDEPVNLIEVGQGIRVDAVVETL